MLYIKESQGKGRGVFTKDRIVKDVFIEACPVIIISKADIEKIDQTTLYDYYFDWEGEAALALGYGSLYNHSYQPNARYSLNLKNRTVDIISLRDIKADEEILVNYNGDPESTKPLWKNDEIDWKD